MPHLITNKGLPFNADAERAVLGAILLNDQLFASVSEILKARDFYQPANVVIFDVMTHLVSSMKRIDLVTLQDELIKKDMLDRIGGPVYLVSLQEDMPNVGLVNQHAHIIKNKSILRALIGSATDIINNCYKQQDEEIDAVIDKAQMTILEAVHKRTERNFAQLNIWMREAFQHLSDIKSNGEGITGIPMGFKQLDRMTAGLQKGDLIILAARPSMGKTAFALNIALNAALEGRCVAIFSLEMSGEQLTSRLVAAKSGISYQRIRNATLSDKEWGELVDVAGDLSELKFFIDDSAGLSMMDVRSKARKIKAEQNVDLIIIDYLQLLHSTKRHENRHQEVSEISRSLKVLAKELSVPIIALSQLSRAVENRMDKRPMMSDLRDSGAIEQDADVVMFLYRDFVYYPETENPNLAELIIGKQRNGPTCKLHLTFEGELMKFEDEPEYQNSSNFSLGF